MNKIIVKYLCLFIVIIAFLIPGCLTTNDDKNKNEKENNKDYIEIPEFSFELWFNVSENIEYELFIPLPLYDNGSISFEIVDNLTIISGSGKFSTLTSPKGKCLKLNGNGEIHLVSNGYGGTPYHFYRFSLRNESLSSMWGISSYLIFFNSSIQHINIPFTLSCYSSSDTNGKGNIRKTVIKGDIKTIGWNEINGFDFIQEI